MIGLQVGFGLGARHTRFEPSKQVHRLHAFDQLAALERRREDRRRRLAT